MTLKGMLGPVLAGIGWLLWWPLVKLSEFGGALIDIGTDWTIESAAAAHDEKR
jgi:hypothetical protein